MLRKVRTAVLAAVVAVAGVQGASAAPIGTFGFVFVANVGEVINLTNEATSGLKFSELELVFCDGSVVPAGQGAAGFLSARGQLQGCAPGAVVSQGFFSDDLLEPSDVTQYVPLPPESGFAFLSMRVSSTDPSIVGDFLFYVDPIDLSCDPTAEDCSTFIYSSPVPEPTSLLLLAGGLGTIAARRLRRRG